MFSILKREIESDKERVIQLREHLLLSADILDLLLTNNMALVKDFD